MFAASWRKKRPAPPSDGSPASTSSSRKRDILAAFAVGAIVGWSAMLVNTSSSGLAHEAAALAPASVLSPAGKAAAALVAAAPLAPAERVGGPLDEGSGCPPGTMAVVAGVAGGRPPGAPGAAAPSTLLSQLAVLNSRHDKLAHPDLLTLRRPEPGVVQGHGRGLQQARSAATAAAAAAGASSSAAGADVVSLLDSIERHVEGPFPAPSSVQCRMAADGFELCEYTNVCLDMQEPETLPGHSRLVLLRALQGQDGLAASGGAAAPTAAAAGYNTGRASDEQAREVKPSGGGDGGEGGGDSADADASGAAAAVRGRRAAAARPAPKGGAPPSDVADLTDLLQRIRGQRAAGRVRMMPPWQGETWADALAAPLSADSDFKFTDVNPAAPGTLPGMHPRLLPVESLLDLRAEPVSAGVPLDYGGAFNGSVTWVDSLYITSQDYIGNPWLYHSTVTGPVLGALYANTSLGLNLPPLENLHQVLRFEHDVKAAREHGSPFRPRDSYIGPFTWSDPATTEALHSMFEPYRWGAQMLYHTLAGARDGTPPSIGSAAGAAAQGYAPWRSFVSRFGAECARASPLPRAAGGKGPRNGTAAAGLTPFCAELLALQKATGGLPASASAPVLPFSALLVRNAGQGTRVLYTSRDLPSVLPLRPGASSSSSSSSSKQQGAPPAAAAPHRVCIRHAVALGTRHNMVGGTAEAAFQRRFAERAFGVAPWPADDEHTLPPRKVLLVDRYTAKARIPGDRFLWNRHEMEKMLRKYDVGFSTLTNDDLTDMKLVDQIKLFSSAGLLIAGHGAALVNSLFMPRRSVVIEVFPFNLLCPVFWKMHMAAGRYVLPIFSRLKGHDLNYQRITKHDSPYALETFIRHCDTNGIGGAVADFRCFSEFRFQAVQVPIHEFEHTLLQALSLIGNPRIPLNSSMDMLHGIPQGDWQPATVPDGDFYQRYAWRLEPPAGGLYHPAPPSPQP